MTENNRRRREETTVYERATKPIQAGKNLSWGSIFAGAVSAAAVFMVLNLITAALGFGLFSPTQDQPLSGVGIGTGIWTIVTLIISFLAGGFVSGYAARSTGLLHGAVTWALTILLIFTLVFNVLASAFGLAGNILGSVANGVGNVAGQAASVAGDAISEGVSKAGDSIADVDTEQLQENIENYLADTEVEELQPEYISDQIQQARDEVTQAVKDLALNPENSQAIVSDLAKSLGDKASEIAGAVDEDAIYTAVSNNSNLTEAEVEEVSSNIYEGLREASSKAQEGLEAASTEVSRLVNEVSSTVDQSIESAKEGAESASNKASAGAVLVFIGLIIALVVSAIGGKLGVSTATKFVER